MEDHEPGTHYGCLWPPGGKIMGSSTTFTEIEFILCPKCETGALLPTWSDEVGRCDDCKAVVKCILAKAAVAPADWPPCGHEHWRTSLSDDGLPQDIYCHDCLEIMVFLNCSYPEKVTKHE